MGVKNLWRLLLPIGHRLSIQTLSHQTLAIDASIWLTQISKACRDPETGRILPNRPHVRIFLLRLMRLLFHQIKPVVVFDGVMPEVKRRELQRRRDIREKLWRDDQGGGDAGVGAMRRTAKKILVQKLKEWRQKEAKLKGGVIIDMNKRDNLDTVGMDNLNDVTGGSDSAFAPGFNPNDDNEQSTTLATEQLEQEGRNTVAAHEEDVISIKSSNTEEIPQQEYEDEAEAENDWELAHAVQASLNESMDTSSTANDHTEYDDYGGFNAINDIPAINIDDGEDTEAANEKIASLPSETRSQWIDSQFRSQRIQSRHEYMSVASKPEEYSSTQLRNFLKGSRLNKRMNEIGALAGKLERSSDNFVDGGQRKIELIDPNLSTLVHGNGVSNKSGPTFHRLKKHAHNGTASDVEDGDIFNDKGTAAPSGVSTEVLFGTDDSDEDSIVNDDVSLKGKFEAGNNAKVNNEENDEDIGGGFVLPEDEAHDVVASNGRSRDASDDSCENSSESEPTDEAEAIEAHGDGNDDTAHKSNEGQLKCRESVRINPSINVAIEKSELKDRRSRFMALSSADEEWESFGNNGVLNSTGSGVQTLNPINAEFSGSYNNARDDTSESDEDDAGATFLNLGRHSTNRNGEQEFAGSTMTSGTSEGIQKPICTCTDGSKIHESHSNVESEADSGEEEDVDWEDGSSEGNDDFENIHVTNESRIDQCHPSFSHISGADSKLNTNEYNGEHIGESKNVSSANETSFAHVEDIHRECIHERNKTQQTILEEEKVTSQNDQIDGSDEIGHRTSAQFVQESFLGRSNNDNVEDQGKVSDVLSVQSIYDDDSGVNEFDDNEPIDPTTIALNNAQETAARLTSWAGRAVQRAIAQHVGRMDDSRKSGVAINDRDVLDNASSGKSLGFEDEEKSVTAAGDVDSAFSSKEPQSIRQQLELFDTSIEGLNQLQQTILDEEKAMERDMSTITDEMKEDILKLLELCGIPWVESPSEAEAQCAALENLGLVDGVVTEDSDIFVFGGRKVYKNFFDEQKYVEAYYAKDAERDLALGKNEMVALAMLLGSDYTDGVKGVGIVNGMEILEAFPVDKGIREGLENFRKWLDGFDDPRSCDDDDSNKKYSSREILFHKKHKSARTRWIAPSDFPSQGIVNAYLKPAVDRSNAKFSWGKPDLVRLEQFCAETLGWDQDETNRVVRPVLKVLENGSKQTRIESYFMKYEDGLKFAKVRSKRLKAVLDDIHDLGNAKCERTGAECVEDEGESKTATATDHKKKRRKKVGEQDYQKTLPSVS
mmetsp:Transcript_10552/g.21749  ORF Transcript_10552/g.21749 Transcript_10552/m.21749 type:complete len:1282 (-) Transcript_10552:243-4088(-)